MPMKLQIDFPSSVDVDCDDKDTQQVTKKNWRRNVSESVFSTCKLALKCVHSEMNTHVLITMVSMNNSHVDEAKAINANMMFSMRGVDTCFCEKTSLFSANLVFSGKGICHADFRDGCVLLCLCLTYLSLTEITFQRVVCSMRKYVD